jgi:ribonuclease-3
MTSDPNRTTCRFPHPDLQYEFKDPRLLEEALRHSSFVNEQADPDLRDNERLEFLGDAVLNLAMGHILMDRFPGTHEGELSRMRANLVNESRLAAVARTLELGRFVRLGRGESSTNGREKNSILADTLEAVIAAVYLDGGLDAAFTLVETHFTPQLDRVHTPAANRDYKSQLQERLQEQQRDVPTYRVVGESGPDHDKIFEVAVDVADKAVSGCGRSKKMAEQDAARKALAVLFQGEVENRCPPRADTQPPRSTNRPAG